MGWILVVCAAVGFVVLLRYLKKKELELDARIQERFAGKNIRLMDKYALFMAQESDGYSHVRGAGTLVLSDEELFYERQIGHKVVSIPLNRIVQVGETRRLAGQSTGRRMLKIDFRTPEGEEDAVGWRVKELNRWKEEIQKGVDSVL